MLFYSMSNLVEIFLIDQKLISLKGQMCVYKELIVSSFPKLYFKLNFSMMSFYFQAK